MQRRETRVFARADCPDAATVGAGAGIEECGRTGKRIAAPQKRRPLPADRTKRAGVAI